MDLLGLTGTTTTTNAPFRSARITWALDGIGSAEVSLMPEDVASGLFRAGQKRLAFRDGGGTRRFQGWLDRHERDGKPGAVRHRVSARGLAAILEQRVVHGDFSKVATVSTTIARDLITHAQAQTDGNHGFTLGTVTGTAPARTRHLCDGDVIADRINELGELDFAWEIDANGAFNVWVGGRGTDLSASQTLSQSETIDWHFTEDVSEMATYVTGLGDRDDDQPCGPPLVVDFTAERTTYGRREYVIEAETLDEAEMEEKTTQELRARVASRWNLQTAWVEGLGPWSFGTVWLGDIVNVELGAEFGGDADMRLTTIIVTLEPAKPGNDVFVECEWEAA